MDKELGQRVAADLYSVGWKLDDIAPVVGRATRTLRLWGIHRVQQKKSEGSHPDPDIAAIQSVRDNGKSDIARLQAAIAHRQIVLESVTMDTNPYFNKLREDVDVEAAGDS